MDLKTEYYDLGLPHRDETRDQVTMDAANATKKYGVAVKCATITPNAQRVEEYKLTEMWKSPNGTIRAILDGTVFRAPIMVKGIIHPVVKNWKKPITIARHAYGDMYKDCGHGCRGAGKAELVFTGERRHGEDPSAVHDFSGARRACRAMHNTDELHRLPLPAPASSTPSISKQDLWFSTKDTISKIYDHTVQGHLRRRSTTTEYKAEFERLGIDLLLHPHRRRGGAGDPLQRAASSGRCKNYDGDVMSDMVATAFGSPWP